VMDTVGSQIVLPGLKDPKVLKDLSETCGTVSMQARGQEHYTEHPAMTPAMVRSLPAKHALVVRDNRAPVVCKVRQVWSDRLYKSLRGTPLPSPAPRRVVAEPLTPVTVDAQGPAERDRVLEPATVPAGPGDAGSLPWPQWGPPAAVPQSNGNGNGHG
jgi:hypothetical protein